MFRLIDALMDLLFLIGVVWTLSRSIRSLLGRSKPGFAGSRNARSSPKADPAKGHTARDPVCGMFVSTEVSHRLVRGGQTFHFCSQECLDKYEKSA